MEVWKDIQGFEGFYQVSNLGNVKSVARVQENKKGVTVHYKSKELKPSPNSSGYLRVELKSPSRKEKWFVHRLVAIHFVPNPDPVKLTIVNHLDSNFLHNWDSNLEWTSYRGNMRHAMNNGRMNRTEEWLKHLRETNETNGQSVVGTNLKTGEKIYFVCLNDCKLKGFQPSCVCQCCKGIRSSHKGYKWEYVCKEGDKM